MRNNLFHSILFCCPVLLLAATPARCSGDLYVWAKSGLDLQQTPDFKGEKIITLPYGTPVEFLEYAVIVHGSNEISGDYSEPERIELIFWDISTNLDAYKTDGSWVKVKAFGKVGYVFDLYLSALPPDKPSQPRPSEFPSVAQGMKNLFDYCSLQWGTLRKLDTTAVIFGNGVYCKAGNSKFEETKWVFPQISEQDAFLLVDYFLDLNEKSKSENPEGFKYSGGGNERRLNFYYQAFSNMELAIRFHADTMIMVSAWGGD